MRNSAMPEELANYAGRIIDVDTHEMIPVQVWDNEFGSVTRDLAEEFLKQPANQPNGLNYPGYIVDDTAIDEKSVWYLKGPAAPGATDPARRLDVMDLTGVTRQLIFPNGPGIMGSFLLNTSSAYGFMADFKGDRRAYGLALIEASNEWAIRNAKLSDRIRPVAALYGSTVDELMETTRNLIDRGIRAVWLMSAIPPGGVSPADEQLGPFWSLLAERDISVTLHIGSEAGFLKTDVWGQAEAFRGFRSGAEFDLSPWRLSIQHLPSQNFLAAMVAGGVFQRHPALRFGVIEVGAFWIGPLAEALDLWHENGQTFGANSMGRLPEHPSIYIGRNVRVSAFPFEPIDRYIDRYGLEDVYCYASDYPHLEGGEYAMKTFADRLRRLGPDVLEKFFVSNGEFLVPA